MLIDRCVCAGITFSQIRTLADAVEVHSLDDLQAHLPVGTGCGLCRPYVRRVLSEGQVVFTSLLSDDEGVDDG